MNFLATANPNIDAASLEREIREEIEAKIAAGEIDPREVERIAALGLTVPDGDFDAAPRPLSYLLDHKETYRGVPGRSHRGSLGAAVIAVKKLFRRLFQIFINEALDPQVVFNDHLVEYLYNVEDRLAAAEKWSRHERDLLKELTLKRLTELERSLGGRIEGIEKRVAELEAALKDGD